MKKIFFYYYFLLIDLCIILIVVGESWEICLTLPSCSAHPKAVVVCEMVRGHYGSGDQSVNWLNCQRYRSSLPMYIYFFAFKMKFLPAILSVFIQASVPPSAFLPSLHWYILPHCSLLLPDNFFKAFREATRFSVEVKASAVGGVDFHPNQLGLCTCPPY